MHHPYRYDLRVSRGERIGVAVGWAVFGGLITYLAWLAAAPLGATIAAASVTVLGIVIVTWGAFATRAKDEVHAVRQPLLPRMWVRRG